MDENNENICPKMNENTKTFKIIKKSIPCKSSFTCKKFDELIPKSKKKYGTKIIKLECQASQDFKSVNIDFSSDKTLLDKLFHIKSLMRIKNKTFI
jgi:hypothetical protein